MALALAPQRPHEIENIRGTEELRTRRVSKLGDQSPEKTSRAGKGRGRLRTRICHPSRARYLLCKELPPELLPLPNLLQAAVHVPARVFHSPQTWRSAGESPPKSASESQEHETGLDLQVAGIFHSFSNRHFRRARHWLAVQEVPPPSGRRNLTSQEGAQLGCCGVGGGSEPWALGAVAVGAGRGGAVARLSPVLSGLGRPTLLLYQHCFQGVDRFVDSPSHEFPRC